MKTLHFRSALLLALGIAVQPGCGGRAGSQEEGGQSVGGTAVTACQAGNTRECVGPGACRGGQQCDESGYWGKCECAATGGASSTGIGENGTGGEVSGGSRAIAGSPAQTTTGGNTPTGGRSSSGGTINVGGTAGASAGSAGTTIRPSGGQGGGGGRTAGGAGGVAGATGGTSSGGTYFTGGSFTGGSFTGGSFTGGSFTGGTHMGGVASGGYSTATGGMGTGGAMNHPPQLTSLGFYPNPVTKNDTLWIYASATDADYDKISYTYSWQTNGKTVGYNSQSLSSYYFSKGDSITVTVTPSDGKSYGETITSQPIVVANAQPVFVSSATLSPSGFAEPGTPLQCAASATDPDGDKVEYTYNWYNSDVVTTYHDATLPGAATAAGGIWTCEIMASDGSAKTWTSSDTTTIATLVSGIYRTDTTWVAAKSPYVLTGRIQVAAGTTLKIEPGVTVLGSGLSLELWGSLLAVGTAQKPIKFDSLYASDFSATDKPSKITLAFAEYISGTLLGNSASAVVNISDCVLNSLVGPIYLPPGARLERNLFTYCCGVYATGPAVLNSNTFAWPTPGYVDVQLTDSLEASGNSFYNNADYVVVLGSKPVDLSNSYWGGTVDADIPALIQDSNDDLNIGGLAEYLPTLGAPDPNAPAADKTYFP